MAKHVERERLGAKNVGCRLKLSVVGIYALDPNTRFKKDAYHMAMGLLFALPNTPNVRSRTISRVEVHSIHI